MKNLIILILFYFLYINQVNACGTVKAAIEGIYGKGPMKSLTKAELFASLAKVGGRCQELTNSTPVKNQERLIKLLLDKSLEEYLNEYGQKIFLGFNCLSTQKSHADYSSLSSRYETSGCPSGKILYVTSSNGGNLRSSPYITNNKLTGLPRGTELKEISRDNQWIKVEVIHSNRYFIPPCKYQSPCNTGYLHESVVD